jgi:CHAD domain-containing protein
MLPPERSTEHRTHDPAGAPSPAPTASGAALADLADYIELHAGGLHRILSQQDALEPDAVHDLRVHGRRLVRALRLAESIVDTPVRPHRAPRFLVDRLAALRDAQVVERRIRKGWADAEARELSERLRAESRRLQKRARRYLVRYESMAPSRLYDQTVALLRSEAEAPARAAPKAALLVGEVARAFLEVDQRALQIDPENGRSLHRLRIALRRYRYDIDALSRLLSTRGTEGLATLVHAQELLGDAQDAEVSRLAVAAHSDDASPGLRRAWRLLSEQQSTVARHRVVEFLERERQGLCTWAF